MRFHAYLAQALIPGNERLKFAQLPGIKSEEVRELAGDSELLEEFVQALEMNGDARIKDVKTAMKTWGRLELIDASFKGPSSVNFLDCIHSFWNSHWGTSRHTIVHRVPCY